MVAETEGVEVTYVPPSETQFVVAVAKDLATEIFSPEYQTMWTMVAVAVVALAVGFLLGRRCK